MIAQMRDPPLCSQTDGNAASPAGWASFYPIFQLYVPTVQNPQCLFLDPRFPYGMVEAKGVTLLRACGSSWRSWRLKHQISTLSHSLETVTLGQLEDLACGNLKSIEWIPLFAIHLRELTWHSSGEWSHSRWLGLSLCLRPHGDEERLVFFQASTTDHSIELRTFMR